MKKLFLLLLIIMLSSCGKPKLLKSQTPAVKADYQCVRLSTFIADRQPVQSAHNQEKVYYFFQLSQFIGELNLYNNCDTYFAEITKIRTTGEAVTVRKGESLHRFNIELDVDMYYQKKLLERKQYQSLFDASANFFLTSNKKKHSQDAVVIQKGLESMLKQIAIDLLQIKNKGKE